MMAADAAARALARRLLAHEAAGEGTALQMAEAAERVCCKLGERLAVLIGDEGVAALLRRALHLAQLHYPFLASVEVARRSRCPLKGLAESVQGRTDPEVTAGLEALVANLVFLLVTFIGKDLTYQQVNVIWPALPHGQEAQA